MTKFAVVSVEQNWREDRNSCYKKIVNFELANRARKDTVLCAKHDVECTRGCAAPPAAEITQRDALGYYWKGVDSICCETNPYAEFHTTRERQYSRVRSPSQPCVKKSKSRAAKKQAIGLVTARLALLT